MAVHVTGTLNVTTNHGEPTSPFVISVPVDPGTDFSFTVEPYTNQGDVDQTVSAVVVSNASNVTVDSSTFRLADGTTADGTTGSLVVPAGATLSVDFTATADASPVSPVDAWSLDVDFTWTEVAPV